MEERIVPGMRASMSYAQAAGSYLRLDRHFAGPDFLRCARTHAVSGPTSNPQLSVAAIARINQFRTHEHIKPIRHHGWAFCVIRPA